MRKLVATAHERGGATACLGNEDHRRMEQVHLSSAESAQLMGSRVLNLGSGRKRLAEALNVGHQASTNPDLVHDLNSIPWPLPENHFETVLLADSLEHLSDVVTTMEENHDAAFFVGELLHRSHAPPSFRYFSFDYFTGEHEFDFYSEKLLRRRSAQIIFYPTLANKLVWRLANRYPRAYERRWAWLFPAWFLSFELEVVK